MSDDEQAPPAGGGEKVTQPDPLIGKVLAGRYHVVAKLGVGGLGAVYRALQAPLSRPVALKVLHEGFGSVDDLRRRFEREARALSTLSHPNIVGINDFGVADGQPYLCMELLEGRTLEGLLAEGPLDPDRALAIAREILRGLAFAHRRGIAHRDLKPANIFLQGLSDAEDHVKLLDFGLAKFLESDAGGADPTLTQQGMIFGTPAYMAPEQGTGGRVDARVDVYAAGVVLFEMLAGCRPFVAKTRAELVRQHLLANVPQIGRVRPQLVVTSELQGFVAKALAKEPGGRFGDAGVMLLALDGLPVPAARIDPTRAAVPGSPGETGQPFQGADGPTLGATPGSRARSGESRPASRRARLVWSGVAALIAIVTVAALAVMIGASVGGGSQPTARRPDAGVRVAPVVTPPTPPPETRRAALDPWRPPLPADLQEPYEQIERGARLSRREIRELYGLASQHPDDAKPQLLLAHAFSNLGWRTDAVARYVRAYRIDVSARGDARMRRDLLALIGSEDAHDRAEEAIVEIYGVEALPEVRAALADRGTQGELRTRLERLERELSTPR